MRVVRVPTLVQRPEVVINGKLHRRPDPGSNYCTCRYPLGYSDDVSWAEHIYLIIQILESKST